MRVMRPRGCTHVARCTLSTCGQCSIGFDRKDLCDTRVIRSSFRNRSLFEDKISFLHTRQ